MPTKFATGLQLVFCTRQG